MNDDRIKPAPTLPNRPIRISVVGDVHDHWEPEDAIALHHLKIDLVLFVGDFGNESVAVVRQIAELDIPKAVIFGNHDAWYTATDWGRKKCPYDRTQEDRVQMQIDLLGETHVGYGKLDFPQLGLTVVGGRPFSWGGSEWKYESFYTERYGVRNLAESCQRIVGSVEAAAHETILFIGHCGPTGLGDHPEAICGRDWKPLGGDHGDPDLTAGIAHAQAAGKKVPLVTFGHMHHHLRHRKDRLREQIQVDATQGTVYLNAARVPRIVQTEVHRQRNFSIVTLNQGQVEQASLAWVNHHGDICSEEILYQATATVALAS